MVLLRLHNYKYAFVVYLQRVSELRLEHCNFGHLWLAMCPVVVQPLLWQHIAQVLAVTAPDYMKLEKRHSLSKISVHYSFGWCSLNILFLQLSSHVLNQTAFASGMTPGQCFLQLYIPLESCLWSCSPSTFAAPIIPLVHWRLQKFHVDSILSSTSLFSHLCETFAFLTYPVWDWAIIGLLWASAPFHYNSLDVDKSFVDNQIIYWKSHKLQSRSYHRHAQLFQLINSYQDCDFSTAKKKSSCPDYEIVMPFTSSSLH